MAGAVKLSLSLPLRLSSSLSHSHSNTHCDDPLLHLAFCTLTSVPLTSNSQSFRQIRLHSSIHHSSSSQPEARTDTSLSPRQRIIHHQRPSTKPRSAVSYHHLRLAPTRVASAPSARWSLPVLWTRATDTTSTSLQLHNHNHTSWAARKSVISITGLPRALL